MATSTFSRKIELDTVESVKKLLKVIETDAPITEASNKFFTSADRERSERLLKQYLSR